MLKPVASEGACMVAREGEGREHEQRSSTRLQDDTRTAPWIGRWIRKDILFELAGV